MTQLDAKRTKPTDQKSTRPWLVAAAAAAIVVIFAGVGILINRDSQPAVTGPPMDVVVETRLDQGIRGGTFTATGEAVDSGAFCAEGVFSAAEIDRNSDPVLVEHQFICADGTGTVALRIEVSVAEIEQEQPGADVDGSWTVIRGTGEYQEIEGSGTLAIVDFFGFYRGELRSG